MKKYLVSLIPFCFCSILSILYGAKEPKNFPDPSYPYQTDYILNYLQNTWFIIGIAISGMFISMFIIGDAFDWVVKYFNKKREDE